MRTNALSGPGSTPASDGRVSIRFSKPESHLVGFADRVVFCVVKSKFGSAGCPAGALRRVGGNVQTPKGWSLVSNCVACAVAMPAKARTPETRAVVCARQKIDIGGTINKFGIGIAAAEIILPRRDAPRCFAERGRRARSPAGRLAQ